MPKTHLKPVSTELVTPGQPSSALVSALKAAGARVTVTHLATAIHHLEGARVGFVCEAIATGVLLLAKQETLAHGQRQKFEAEVWEEVQKANRKRVSDLPVSALDNFTRSLRGYRFLAQHFLADLEQGNFQPEGRDQVVTPPPVQPQDVLALDALPQEKRIAVYGAIATFVDGRSLRRMLMDFRRAENAADQEEAAEAEAARKKARKDKGDQPGQLDFWDDLARPLGQIETLFQDQSFVQQTTKEFWLQAAERLDAQAKFARAKAKEIKG